MQTCLTSLFPCIERVFFSSVLGSRGRFGFGTGHGLTSEHLMASCSYFFFRYVLAYLGGFD